MADSGPDAVGAAHALRDLAARKGTGVVPLGDGVRAHVRDGWLVNVTADADATSFGEHLVLSGALTSQARADALRRAEDDGISFHVLVRDALGWSDDALADAARKHLVRRLSRGLSAADDREQPAGSGDVVDGPFRLALGPALVEALAAIDDGPGDTPELPAGATFVVAEDAAASWTGVGEHDARRVAADDLRDAWAIPARARALRAAIRAGFVRIELPELPAVPELDVAEIVPLEGDAVASLPTLVRPERTDRDPLDEVEGHIVSLELTDGSATEIAAAWREAARLWGHELCCPEEAARCERNACAAAPKDPEAHLAAARWSAALGENGLAAAQARVAAANAAAGDPTRTRALELLAIASWQTGDLDNAVETIAEAVWEAPGDPALLALGARLMLEAQRPEEAERWRREAASAKHEIPPLDAILEGTSALRGESPDAVLRELSARVAKDGPDAILAATEAAIAPSARVKGTAAAVAAALRRVSESGEPALAAAMGIRALDATGNRSPELRDATRSAAEASGDAHLLAAVLERHVAIALAATHRVELLARVADCWEQLDRPLFAARALTRALVHLPADTATLSRLASLYERAWDAQRSIRTLEKLRELASDAATRADVLVRLATVAFRMQDDPRRARGYVERALSEPSLDEASRVRACLALVALGAAAEGADGLLALAAAHPDEREGAKLATAAILATERAGGTAEALDACRRALDRWPRWSPLLVAFERLVARAGTSEVAHEVFERVASRAWGPNGRRAVYYRGARLLDRLGDQPRSLEMFARAFALAPSTGTVLAAIERLSEATGRYAPLADAYARLATRATDAGTLVARLRRAARIAEEKLGDARGAFDHLLNAFKVFAEPGLDTELRRLALVLADLGDEEPIEALGAALADRAERAWDVEERLPYVTSLAKLRAEHGDLEEALATLAPVAREPEGRPSIEVALEIGRARGEERRVRTWLADMGVSAPKPSPVESSPLASSLVRLAESEPPAVPTSSPPPPSAFEAEETIKSERPSFEPIAPAPEVPAPAGGPVEPRRSSSGTTSSVPPAPQVWKSAEPEDEVRMALRLAREPGQRAGAIHRLRALVRAEPARTNAIRALRDLLLAADATNEATMMARVTALFERDAGVAAPAFGVPLNHVESAAASVSDGESAAADEVLALVWEHARPLFRQELAEHGVSDLDRIAPSDGSSFGRGVAACLHALELGGTLVFRKRTWGRRARAVVGPVGQALILGDLDPGRAEDRFLIGRALEGTRPARAMALALEASRGDRAMRAIGAAFGRTELSAETERDCISLAASMWQTVPSRVQRRLRAMLEERAFPTPAVLRANARRAALRSGLLLSGDVMAAVAELTSDDPDLSALLQGDEGAFVSACARSEPLATLVRFAASDAMLSMRWTMPATRAPGDVLAGGE
ncbi:MAG: hypothetical protein IT379_31280 [Deltaproteobacteria bacterium]|nr:hypothetical protein [Deltaproteobacteria bacterium]